MVLNFYFTRVLRYSLVLLLFAGGFSAAADVLFEGYSKILMQGQRTGYVVHRYEFKPKKKRFYSTYFIMVKTPSETGTESLQAECNHDFSPVKYAYTSNAAGKIKTIDATFKGNTMNVVIGDGKNQQSLSKKLPKGSFLSTFLGYLMLNQGYSKDKRFTYHAVAEEDAEVFTGQTVIREAVKVQGLDAFRVVNSFKKVNFASFITDRGEVLSTASPLQGIATELVPVPAMATEGYPVPVKSLKILFGNVPKGTNNSLSRAHAKGATPVAPAPTETKAEEKKAKKGK